MTSTQSALIISAGILSLLGLNGCVASTEEGDLDLAHADTVNSKDQALSGGCGLSNSVPLQGPNVSNRLGSNACTSIIPPFLPEWWQYGDGTARVQIANFNDSDPNENAFPLTVEWENTCGTESGTVTYTQPWQQHELGHPSEDCSIVIKLGGAFTEDVLIYWGS